MQGRAILQEIVRIRGELNCMHKYYSTLHETSFGKVEVLHNSNIHSTLPIMKKNNDFASL